MASKKARTQRSGQPGPDPAARPTPAAVTAQVPVPPSVARPIQLDKIDHAWAVHSPWVIRQRGERRQVVDEPSGEPICILSTPPDEASDQAAALLMAPALVRFVHLYLAGADGAQLRAIAQDLALMAGTPEVLI